MLSSALTSKSKASHIQVGVGSVVTAGNLGGVMVITLAWKVRDVDSIPALETIFPISITPTTRPK